MKTRLFFQLLLTGLALAGLINCGEGELFDLTSSSESSVDNSASETVFTLANQDSLDLPAGNYVFIPFSTARQAANQGYLLESTTAIAPFSRQSATSANLSRAKQKIAPGLEQYHHHMAAEMRLRQAFTPSAAPFGPAQSLPTPPMFSVASSTFSMATFTGNSSDTITANLAKEGEYADIYVDSLDSVDETALSQIQTTLEAHIIPRNQAFFGDESSFGCPGKLLVVITSFIYEENNLQLLGAFDRNQLTNAQQKTIFVVPPDLPNDPNLLNAVIGHEYQHLINFCAKRQQGVSGGEDTWLDEGLSHLAEDLQGYGTANLDFVRNYFPNIPTTPLLGPDNTERRGGNYLYLRYLFERLGGVNLNSSRDITDEGGAKLLRCLVQSGQTGVANLLGCQNGQLEAKFADWVATLYIDPQMPGSGRYHYQAPQADPETGISTGLDLAALNLTPTLSASLSGESYAGSVASMGQAYYQATLSSPATISLSGDPYSNLGLTIVHAD
jgi:hypothetical protein